MPYGQRAFPLPRIFGDQYLTPEEEAALLQTPPFMDPQIMPSKTGETETEQVGIQTGSIPPTFQPRQSKPGWKGVLMAGLQGAIDGASTPNIAYGGGTDIMRAAANASEMARQRQMQDLQLQRQRSNDAYMRNRDQRADAQLTEAQRAAKVREAFAEAKLRQDSEKAIEKEAQDIVETGKGEFLKDLAGIPDEMRPRIKEYSIGGQKRYVRLFTEDEKSEREYKTKAANAKRAGLTEGTEAWKKAVLGAAYLAPEKETKQNLIVRDSVDDVTGNVKRRFYNPATSELVREEVDPGAARKRPPASTQRDPNEISPAATARLNMMVDNIRQDKDFVNYKLVKPLFQTMKQASTVGNGVGDLTMLRAFARITDPSTGIREEEYRSMQSAQGALQRMGIRISRGWFTGEQLTEAGRAAFLKMGSDIYSNYEANKKDAEKLYRGQAKAIGVDADLILGSSDAQTPPQQPGGAATIRMMRPDGQTGRVPAAMQKEYEAKGYKLVPTQ